MHVPGNSDWDKPRRKDFCMNTSRVARRAASGIVAALLLAVAFLGLAATANAETPAEPATVAAAATEPEVQPITTAQPILCLMPGDTMELRAGIGAIIGGLAGLPIFIVGAIPGAIIGAGMGALSWQIANWSLQQQGGCHP
ncbi:MULTISPECIES: hypothetical protein [Nocardia]|nr:MULTISPECIES: hypothetical protein [Nocardia]